MIWWLISSLCSLVSSCTCPEGFTGPRCQQLKLSFTGAGWAWFEPLSQCEAGKTSFEFLTSKPNALLLYNGPMNSNEPHDFISVELVGGHPKVRVDLGEDEIVLEVTTGKRLDNGKWHTLEIFKDNKVCLPFFFSQLSKLVMSRLCSLQSIQLFRNPHVFVWKPATYHI